MHQPDRSRRDAGAVIVAFMKVQALLCGTSYPLQEATADSKRRVFSLLVPLR